MLNKLSRKDIELLNDLAQTPEGKSALHEYIEQHEKAVKAYKVYRESVVAEAEVEKVVKPVGTKRKFKAGDKVRVLCTGSLSAATLLREGDIATVTGYKEHDNFMLAAMGGEPLRPVIVRSMEGGGLLSTYPTGFFEESALELVKEKSQNESRAEIIRFSSAREYLKNARKSNDMTLQGLASKLGVSHQYLSQLENGKRKITYEICAEIIKVLKLDNNYFKCLCGYLTKEEYIGLEFLKLQNDGSESSLWEALRIKREAAYNVLSEGEYEEEK